LPAPSLAAENLTKAYELWALSGDATKARTAYEDFLALWKDADPILKEAKEEYVKLL
jgi:eukaryotic-like serine/threonine-protein kinase